MKSELQITVLRKLKAEEEGKGSVSVSMDATCIVPRIYASTLKDTPPASLVKCTGWLTKLDGDPYMLLHSICFGNVTKAFLAICSKYKYRINPLRLLII